MYIFRFEEIVTTITQISILFVEKNNNIKIINLILIYKIIDLLIYNKL